MQSFIGMTDIDRIILMMNDWLRQNAWALAIGAITLASSYAVYGYKISDLETATAANAAAISAEQNSTVTNNLQVQVALAKLQTDMDYIKQRLGGGAIILPKQ